MLRKPGGDRGMVGNLSPVLRHVMSAACFSHDERAVICAVEMALGAGVPTKTHVLKLLHGLVDGAPIGLPDVTPPSSLVLTKEPEANIALQDGLRGAHAMDPFALKQRAFNLSHGQHALTASASMR